VPTLTPGQIYALAIDVGLSADKALVATAVALAESGGRTDAVGDVALQDAKWGPSIGLWQIRSLKEQSGTGGPRDATRLKDPRFNAQAMRAISGNGQSFNPWSTYKDGAYKKQIGKISGFDAASGVLGSIPIIGPAASAVVSAGSKLTSSWGNDAMTIGLKIMAAGSAVALVVVGAVHTVSK
jgi:hypothetical protein